MRLKIFFVVTMRLILLHNILLLYSRKKLVGGLPEPTSPIIKHCLTLYETTVSLLKRRLHAPMPWQVPGHTDTACRRLFGKQREERQDNNKCVRLHF